MTTITEFLLARIAEDEAAAWLVLAPYGDATPHNDAAWWVDEREWFKHHLSSDETPLLTRFTPQRVLAECAAKRRIVERHKSTEVLHHYEFGCTCGFSFHNRSECLACGKTTYDEGEIERTYGPCIDLLLLALPYSSHSDYDETWRPA